LIVSPLQAAGAATAHATTKIAVKFAHLQMVHVPWAVNSSLLEKYGAPQCALLPDRTSRCGVALSPVSASIASPLPHR
jgi:hypothetical protein